MNSPDRVPGKARGRSWVLSVLVLTLLALVLGWPVVRHPSWWLWKDGAPVSDLAVTHWPNAVFARRTLWQEGRFPIWRPTIMSGVPFAANPLTGLYYPPNWLLLFLPWIPLETSFNLSALIHLVLAGVWMKGLVERGLGAGSWGGLLAAVAYGASPKLLAHLGAGHIGWTQAWAWLPGVLLCALEACRGDARTRLLWAAAGGTALAIQFCADVRLAAYTVIGTGLLLTTYVLSGPDSDERSPEWMRHGTVRNRLIKASSPALLFVGAFIGLAACQWVPSAALLPDTTRAAMSLSDGAVWSLPWRYLGGLVLGDYGGFHEWMTYIGPSTLILAAVGVRTLWRDRDQRWLAGWLVTLAVFGAWFSLGRHGGLFSFLWRLVPGLSLLRVPPRAWVLVTTSVAAAAGVGLGDLARRTSCRSFHPSRLAGYMLLGAGALPPMLLAGYAMTMGRPPLNLITFGVITPLSAGIIARLGCSMAVAKPIRSVLAAALVLLVAVDLLAVDLTLIGARPPVEVFERGRAAAEWLADRPGRFRVYSPSYSIPQHVAETYGVELADGVDPVQLEAYAGYLTRAAGLPAQPDYSVTLPPVPEGDTIGHALSDVCPDPALLGQLGVRYVAAAYPLPLSNGGDDSEGGFQFVDRMDGVFLYRNLEAKGPEPPQGTPTLALADGTILYTYRTWPLMLGGTVSAATALALAGWTIVTWTRRQDG